MQTFKKIIFSVFVFVFVFLGYRSASAQIIFDPVSPQLLDTDFTVMCESAYENFISIYSNEGDIFYGNIQPCSSTIPRTISGAMLGFLPNTYQFVSCNFETMPVAYGCGATWLEAILASSFVNSTAYTFTGETPPVVTGITGIKFFEDTALTGENSVTNQLGASVGTTTGSFLPVLAVVGGVILAFIGIKFIVEALRSTKEGKKRI